MLTNLIARNFKRFGEVEVELANVVVLIGPNNSGKTSALQALAFWQLGVRSWNEKRRGKPEPKKRPGVTIGRRDLIALPVPDANLLWRNLHVRALQGSGKELETRNVRIDILVKGISRDRAWECGLEFDYANEESFYCRPLRLSEGKNPDRMSIPDEATRVQVVFLPPMSGLAANESRLDLGAIKVLVGEGRTAEVLRNLCHMICEQNDNNWSKVTDHIKRLFGAELERPKYIPERGEIVMSYRERGTLLDLSSSGRGLQQTLLLLAYMYANPGAVLLLDEPDAHLEILRQRHVYQLLKDVARENGSQIIAASHSEVLLNEAAGRDVVVAFVGRPHRIDNRGSQVVKALRDIGYEDYYQAEQTGWVLYLEGSTDLALLRTFAQKLGHADAERVLERPFVHYVWNQPNEVRRHFFGLREAVPHLKGVALFDKLGQPLPEDLGATGLMWSRREIENYLCYPETLEAYATSTAETETFGPLFSAAESERRIQAMRESISEVQQALQTLGRSSPWDANTKVSDDFLAPLFEKYFKKLGLPNVMAKNNYDKLAPLVPSEKIDVEVREKLNDIVRVASNAKPVDEQP